MEYVEPLKWFLTAFGWKPLMILFDTAIVFLLILYIISIKTKTTIKFNIWPPGFEIKGTISNAINYDVIQSILDLQEESIRECIKIENNILKRQLVYCEQMLAEFKYVLCNNYYKMLSDKLNGTGEDVKTHKDYRFYQMIVAMLIRDLREKVFLDAFVENHFTELDELAWKKYLEDKSNYILNFTNEFVDIMYSDSKIISRKDSYEEEKKLFPTLKEIIRKIFDGAKEFSENNKKELQKVKEDAKFKLKEVCKLNGVQL